MKIGGSLALPWMADLGALEHLTVALEEAGFDHVTTAGHILSAAPDRYEGRPPATYSAVYRDPFVLFAHLAARTTTIRFRTAILILPLYPTVLVARQAADLAHVSGDRFELGIGISWQEAEYDALGQNIHDRGRRVEEQIEVLRLLWTQPLVTFTGEYHTIDRLGLLELPKQPIRIVIGCGPVDRLLRRVARLADGWMPIVDPSDSIGQLREFVVEAGRDPADVAITARIVAAGEDPQAWVADAVRLSAAGATELVLNPPPDAGPEAGLEALITAKRAIDAALA